ncbi:hypothetical protein TWF694_007681 [Orbilia ellipsospora]|uniref:Amidohydrolase-related domain-containing protein n=1 Tax=Orbilia ellipsospora TaxID=2528407 RepID=A0AAV9XL09_9PEZI
MDSPTLLLDTHIHLWREHEIQNLAWQSPEGPLFGVYDLEKYKSCISPIPPSYGGFIFVETDRKFTDPKDPSEDLTAWEHVLEEYRYLLQLSKNDKQGKQWVKGIVPFAPIHLGYEAMQRYKKQLEAVDTEVYGDEKHSLLVGFRYLVQDKPAGTASAPEFIEGLKFMRDNGLVFDLGIDMNRVGLVQFEEALGALKQVDGLKIVINHLTKPPLGREPDNGGIEKWRSLMEEIAKLDSTMKLSGGFSELPSGLARKNDDLPIDEIISMVLSYAKPIFTIFGPRRIIWGSDWPVCGIGYEQIMGEQKDAWHYWLKISKTIVSKMSQEEDIKGEPEDWEGIWGRNAIRAYNLPGF